MRLHLPILIGALGLFLVAPVAQSSAGPGRGASQAAVDAAAPVHPLHPALISWKPRPWSPPASIAPGAGGFRVSRDPVDGTIGMPDDATIAGQAGIESDAPVLVEVLPDGTMLAHLDDRWADFAVATIGADGRAAWQCVPGREGVAQFLARPVSVMAPARPKWEEK